MPLRCIFHVGCVMLLLAVQSARVEARQPDRASDKSRYHLFNPTPRPEMRELSADRPDITESPYTVDAGHVQLEMSFVEFGYDDEDDVTTRTWLVAPFNFKVGLLNNVDLQLVAEPYVRGEIDNSADETIDGFGETQLRLKVNLWGNDGGETAFGVMPFIEFPTSDEELRADDSHVEGGVIFPFAASLPGGWSLGLMAEFDFLHDVEDDDYETDFLHTVALGHDIVGNLAGYIEYIGIAPLDGGDYQSLVGTGLTYGVNADLQFDVGLIAGLSDEADDFTVFTGITVRL